MREHKRKSSTILQSGKHRIPAWILMWSASATCKGFALPKAHQIMQQPSNLLPHGGPSYRHLPSYDDDTGSQSSKRIYSEMRGGAIDSTRLRNSSDDDDNNIESANDLLRRRGMGAALSATYFTVMASKCALPAVLVQLTSPKIGLIFSSSGTSSSSTQILMSRLLTVSTVAIALGKVLLGPVIDHFGGIFSLKIALSLLAILLGIISVSKTFVLFAFSWVIVDFIFSSCWAACINAIHQSFPEQEWAKRIGLLAAAARTGNAAAFAFFAWILAVASERMAQPWRVVFAASAIIQVVPIALLTYFGRLKPPKLVSMQAPKDSIMEKDHTNTTMKASIAALRREAKTMTFWLHLVSRSVLMVFASFLLFVPLLMSEAYGTTASVGAQVGSIYALGCLLSVTLGSAVYSKLPKRSRAVTVACLLSLSTMSSAAHLFHMTGALNLSSSAAAFFLFLWGLSFAIPFYLPPSLYALARGGVESSATIADVFDIGGFVLLAVFNGYVASIEHAKLAAWIPTFQLTTGCSFVALICLTLAVLLE